jgi:anti-anti-sigma factor
MIAIAPGWDLDVERGPGWLLARLKQPESLADNAPPLADAIWEQLCRHFSYRVVIELDEVPVLNSHLIGQLVKLYKRIREHDGVMRLCGLSSYNLQVLRTCRLEDHFAPYEDRREAVMACSLPRQPR